MQEHVVIWPSIVTHQSKHFYFNCQVPSKVCAYANITFISRIIRIRDLQAYDTRMRFCFSNSATTNWMVVRSVWGPMPGENGAPVRAFNATGRRLSTEFMAFAKYVLNSANAFIGIS